MARLHTPDELNDVATRCGLALGELFQDASEKRLVFLLHPEPSQSERSCVAGWARQNGLRAVFVNAIQYQGS